MMSVLTPMRKHRRRLKSRVESARRNLRFGPRRQNQLWRRSLWQHSLHEKNNDAWVDEFVLSY